MEYLITPYAKENIDSTGWDDAFNMEELDVLQKIAKEAGEVSGLGNEKGTSDSKVRRSKNSWVLYSPDTSWIFKKLSHVISSLNGTYYNFDLTGFGEPLQLTNYESINNGTYDWHIDTGIKIGPSRKLSLSLQLSDPQAYEGGILELENRNSEIIKIPKKRGLISVFPSFTKHRVSPVIAGSRQSLVVWISGPPFR